MLRVKAVPGIKAPLAHKPKIHIPDDRFIEVEDNHYYRSMVRDDDLLEATDEQWAAQQAADAKMEADAIAVDKKARADAAKSAGATMTQ